MAHRHNYRAWRMGVALVMAVTLLAAGIADSPSELAAQMRTLIREKVAAGETDQQIVDYFVSKYGEWILLEPPRRGLLWIVWLAPAAALLGGAYLALSYVLRPVRASGR